jgi:type III secretory pathway component EscS
VGESTAVAHAIFIIVSTIVAGLVAAVVIGKLGTLQSVISQGIQEEEYAYGVKLSVVYGYFNDSLGAYIIYVKNSGVEALRNISEIDVYLGNVTGVLQYYSYNSNGGKGHWNYTELGIKDGVWEPKETVIIYVYTGSSLGDLVKVKLVLPWGTSFEDIVES